ncbi:CheY-like chemotaxis protein [Friedmanniella endophytica]|uniref:CheY-like chemotaxis protein n=1 Tax=Microlunatus kandeliicorticis TaxID=1759536 RepID=A0A7W3IQK6_9ACTN|nr:response regulator [Microlunatus kandeliicorticis]MBA8793428.1 CheY-like chemotaxis protein [Microlunatus kandeliicorticis]
MSPRHVLVVDDDDSIREVARMTLELVGGWQVSVASSGAEAWQKVRELRPDAMLLDVMMPGMDGPTTLQRMREDPDTPDVPVIMMTAKDVPMEQRRELGLAGLIAKPFDPLTLSDQVSEILGWSA